MRPSIALLGLLCLTLVACTPRRGGSSGSGGDDDDAPPPATDGALVWQYVDDYANAEDGGYTYYIARAWLETVGDPEITCDSFDGYYIDGDDLTGGGWQFVFYRGAETDWQGDYGQIYSSTCGNDDDNEDYTWINQAHCFGGQTWGDQEYAYLDGEEGLTLRVTSWTSNAVQLSFTGPDGVTHTGRVLNCGEWTYSYGDDDDSVQQRRRTPTEVAPEVPDDRSGTRRDGERRSGGWGLRFR